MKKKLNINLSNDLYNIEIANCMEYHIGRAINFFDDKYTLLFFSYLCYYKNYINNSDFINKILDKLYIDHYYFEYDVNNIIKNIIHNIDNDIIMLLEVPSSTLFYHPLFNNVNIKNINHSIIIEGYDDENDLLFIRDASLCKSDFASLTISSIPASLQITFDMFLNIIIKSNNIIDGYFEKSLLCLKTSNKNYYKSINNFYNDIYYNGFMNDNLIVELNKTLDRNYFHDYYKTEQFRRDYLLSFKPFFDFFNIKYENIDLRKNTINYLYKSSFLNKQVNKETIDSCIKSINILNENLQKELIDSFNKKINYKKIDDIAIKSDSEISRDGIKYSINNLINNKKNNDFTNYWVSTNSITEHYVKLKSNSNLKVDRIEIEHVPNIQFITKDYDLYGFDGKQYILINKIRNNNLLKNIIEIEGDYKSFKIQFIKVNENYDNSARLKKIILLNKKNNLINCENRNSDNGLNKIYSEYKYLKIDYNLNGIMKLINFSFKNMLQKEEGNYFGDYYSLDILKSSKKYHKRYNCLLHAIVANELLLSFNFKSRMIYLFDSTLGLNGNHVMVEVFSIEYNKWILFEATGGFYFSYNGIPLTILELYDLLNSNKKIDLIYINNNYSKLDKHFDFDKIEYLDYLKTMLKFLVIKSSQNTIYVKRNIKLYLYSFKPIYKSKIKFNYCFKDYATVIKEQDILW